MTAAPHDAPDIAAVDFVIRRINEKRHLVWDHDRQCRRISSMAFQASSGYGEGMSVDIEALIVAAGEEPQSFVVDADFAGAVAILVGNVRQLNLLVGYDPLDANPYHGQVWRSPQAGQFTRRQRKGLAKAAAWYVEIEGVAIR